MPPARQDLRGLKAIVELAAGNIGNAGPDAARQHHAFLVARNPGLMAAVAVILDDQHRLGPGRWNLNAKNMGAKLLWRAEVDRGDCFAHCSTSACSRAIPSLPAKSFRSWPEAKCALRKVMVTGVSGANFSKILVSSAVMKAASTRTSPTMMF